jgi:hypothetical protein
MTNTNNRQSFPKLGRIRNKTKRTSGRRDINQLLIENVEKIFMIKDFHSNNPNTQGNDKTMNLGMKKFGDNPHEPLK